MIDEPADVSRRGRLPVVTGGRATSRAGARRRRCPRAGRTPTWRGATGSPRLTQARTLELTWESEVEGAPPGGNPFGWHEPVLPPTPIGDLAETVTRWRREGLRVVLASDQSARLSEILGEADIVAAPSRL